MEFSGNHSLEGIVLLSDLKIPMLYVVVVFL